MAASADTDKLLATVREALNEASYASTLRGFTALDALAEKIAELERERNQWRMSDLQARDALAELGRERDAYKRNWKNASDILDVSEARAERYEKALSYYACESNYNHRTRYGGPTQVNVLADHGKRARAALDEKEER